MSTHGSHRIAWMCACLASGPIYHVANTLASAVDRIPQPIVIGWRDTLQFILMLIPATLFGFFVAAMPLGVAVLLLSRLARSWLLFRAPLAWAAAGGMAAVLLLLQTGTEEFSDCFALLATGMISLRLARAYLGWPEVGDRAAVLGSKARSL